MTIHWKRYTPSTPGIEKHGGRKLAVLPLGRSNVLQLVSRPDSLGVITFTYAVGQMHGSEMHNVAWSPRPGFQADSLNSLMNEVPGASHASGLGLLFCGPGFRIQGRVFDESDLARVKADCNSQVDLALIERGHEILSGNLNLNLQIYVIQEERCSNCWIFS